MHLPHPRILLTLCAGFTAGLLSAQETFLRISELRIDEPGDDVNEYFELQGTPGLSLDDVWYIVLGDHSNTGNPDPNPPNYRSGVVEFALDLSGNTIGPSGFFLVATGTFTLAPAKVDYLVERLLFENNDNVTHILVRGYQHSEVTAMADQFGNLAVNVDPNNNGTLIDPLPWAETIDAIGLIAKPNALVNVAGGADEYVYGAALGFTDIGPDGSFVPGHVYRGNNDGVWNMGIFSLAGGLNLDTPGGPNPDSVPQIMTFTPRVVVAGDTFMIIGNNLGGVTEVRVGETVVPFSDPSFAAVTVAVPAGLASGPVTLVAGGEAATTTAVLRVLPASRAIAYHEDFELSLGDFLTVSIASNQDWYYRTFGGNGFAQMSGFGADTPSDDWLISPPIDLSGVAGPILEFETARNFPGPDLGVFISTNYLGGNPATATWTPVTATLSAENYIITSSGQIDLAAFVGQSIRVGFHYTSTGVASNEGATYQVHDFLVSKVAEDGFQAGWEFNDTAGWLYLFDPTGWAYSEIFGYGFTRFDDWAWLQNFGWFSVGPGTIDTGLWMYSDIFGWIWTRADLGGMFYYVDGTPDYFQPQG